MSEITAPYVLNTNQSGQEVIDDVLGYLIGEMVSVCYTTTRNEKRFQDLSDPSRSFTVETGDRDNFHTQISVHGHLEGNEKTGRYRVFIYDNNSRVNTFCYFYNHSVWSIKEDSSTPAIIFIA